MMSHTNIDIPPVSLNWIVQGAVLYPTNKSSSSVLPLLVCYFPPQNSCGPVEGSMSLYRAPQLSSLHHLLLAVVPLSLSELQPSHRYVRRVETCHLASQGQHSIQRGGADDVRHKWRLDEAWLKRRGQLILHIRLSSVVFLSFLPLVSRVIGCFRAMWWTLTHTLVLVFSSSLRGSLHWL